MTCRAALRTNWCCYYTYNRIILWHCMVHHQLIKICWIISADKRICLVLDLQTSKFNNDIWRVMLLVAWHCTDKMTSPKLPTASQTRAEQTAMQGVRRHQLAWQVYLCHLRNWAKTVSPFPREDCWRFLESRHREWPSYRPSESRVLRKKLREDM